MNNPILTAIDERRTTNLFDPSCTIDDAQISELVRLATKAPTSFNLQNWRFIAVRSPERKAELRAVAWDQVKITNSAVTFIVVGQMADHRTLQDRLAPLVAAGVMPETMVGGWEGAAASLYEGQPWRQRDEAVRSAIFGATTLIYAAQAMGLGSAPMIGFDPEAVARHFELAENEIPVLLLSIGRATSENWSQKPRRPLAQVLDFA